MEIMIFFHLLQFWWITKKKMKEHLRKTNEFKFTML